MSWNIPTRAQCLFYSAGDDSFFFRGALDQAALVTHQEIFSTVARLFDPLGLLAPYTLVARALFQNTWMGDWGWDQELPSPIAEA